MGTGQRCVKGATTDSSAEFGVGPKDDQRAKIAKPRMTPADAVYMTATVTAGILLLITAF